MTENPRPDVAGTFAAIAKALTAAGWTITDKFAVRVHRHPSGVQLVRHFNGTGGYTLCWPIADAITAIALPAHTPAVVVIAACLALSGQLDPTADRVESGIAPEVVDRLRTHGVDDGACRP